MPTMATCDRQTGRNAMQQSTAQLSYSALKWWEKNLWADP